MPRRGLPALVPLLLPTALLALETPRESQWSLRAGVGSDVAPDVHETITSASGATTKTHWGTSHDLGHRFHVGMYHYTTAPHGPLLGSELAFSSYTLGKGSDDFPGTQGYRRLGVDVLAGWQWGLTGDRAVRGHVEVTPLVGVGTSWLTVGTDRALTYSYGLRTGAFVDERGWTLGVTLGWIRSWSTLTTTTSTGTNRLSLTAEGFRFGAETGYAF